MRYARIRPLGSKREPFYARLDGAAALVLDRAPWLSGRDTGESVAWIEHDLIAPVEPSKIVCVGRNYAAHAKELGNEAPSEPLLFLKPPSAVIGPNDAIVLPVQSSRVEHEAELALVISKRLRNASVAQARAGLFGITCAGDITARDLQRIDVQFTRGKGFDTFCPVGPRIVADLDPSELPVACRVNGAVRQTGNTRDMVFGVAELIAFISNVMTLERGDLIATGTPARTPRLRPGDLIETEIPGVARMANPVVGPSNLSQLMK